MVLWAVLLHNCVNFGGKWYQHFSQQRPKLGNIHVWPVSSNLVCNEGERASPYSPCHSPTLVIGNYIIGVKNNIKTFNYICRLIVNMFYCGRIILIVFNTHISKVWGSASRAQRPLPTGIVRRQFPLLTGTMWRNNAGSTRNGSGFEHHIRILNGWYQHLRC